MFFFPLGIPSPAYLPSPLSFTALISALRDSISLQLVNCLVIIQVALLNRMGIIPFMRADTSLPFETHPGDPIISSRPSDCCLHRSICSFVVYSCWLYTSPCVFLFFVTHFVWLLFFPPHSCLHCSCGRM